jgi:hypothetical protein
MTVSNVRKNLRIDVQGNNASVKAGEETVERCITVSNRGRERAAIQISIETNDPKSESLIQWCTYEPNMMPISVDAGANCQVTLRFKIPPQAEPGFYRYEICAQAPQYFGEIDRRSQQFQVLPSNRYLETLNEPRITLDPLTSSESPYPITPGIPFPITVKIENNSNQVERFFLKCPELDPSWFKIDFNASSTAVPGLPIRSDGLPINPRETGIITLWLTPPANTLAGHYSSTLRIRSSLRDDLVLLDIIYFNIEADPRLDLGNLSPQSRIVPSSTTTFQFLVSNPGNMKRSIELRAGDAEQRFKYIFSPNFFQLLPGENCTVQLTAKQKKWTQWNRSWRGKDYEIPFHVQWQEAQPQGIRSADAQRSPLLLSADDVTGLIIWKSRPKWWLWALIRIPLAIVLLLVIAALLKALDWSIQEFVIKPSLRPQILEFAATKKSYQEGTGDPILLNFDIKNPEQLTNVKVTTRPNQEEEPSFYSKKELTEQCPIINLQPDSSPLWGILNQFYAEKIPSPRTMMQCRGILARPLKSDSENNQKTQLVEAQVQGNYEIAIDSFMQSDSSFSSLQTMVRNSQNWLERMFGTQKKQAETSPKVCQSSILIASKVIKDISVALAPPPAIAQFAAKMPTYRVANPEAPGIKNAQEPFAPIQLNWSIENSNQIDKLVLRNVYVAPDGTTKTEEKAYPVKDGKVTGLENFCKPPQNPTVLTCQDVPVQALTAGQYNIFLNVVLLKDRPDIDRSTLAKNTGLIQVKPPLPEIQDFQINGQTTLGRPKQIFLVNPLQGSINVSLSWQIKNREQMKVELLPAPGVIELSQPNKITYALSPNPGSTAVTLRVTNAIGEMVERIIVMETAVIPSAPQSQPTAPAAATPPGSTPPPPPSQAQPVPPAPSRQELPPYELPPRTN